MKSRNIKRTVLIIDDDRLFCDATSGYLRGDGVNVLTAFTGNDGMAACAKNRVDVVLLDQNLPDFEGHQLCAGILKQNDQTKIIFVTAHPSFDGAVKAVRTGAYDYLSKPFEPEELTLIVERALDALDLERIAQVEHYQRHKACEQAVLVGRDGGLSEVARLVDLAAAQESPVLITGETGTGKNVVARAIHYSGPASEEAFISINCAALPENLIEAELFGHERGAFTGAVGPQRGIFEMAEGGTLLLDEIGEMPTHLQTKLLGALEDKQIKRIGGETFRPIDVRPIAATSTSLERTLGKTFRRDLYYRLSVILIHIPPLRDHPQDIPALCDHLLQATRSGGKMVRLEPPELERLQVYSWPGNVRELRNVLERACILQKGPVIRPSELLQQPAGTSGSRKNTPAPASIESLREMERRHIQQALEAFSGNYTRAARALGVALSTLKRKAKGYSLI